MTKDNKPVPQPGDKMQDGAVFAGISPETGRPMYTTPRDARFSWLRRDGAYGEAQAHARNLQAHGHKDWRVPTLSELRVLFNNRAAIGKFSDTNACPDGWYWTSTTAGEDSTCVDVIKFRSGRATTTSSTQGAARLRCVRS